jgi:hypothetical protein
MALGSLTRRHALVLLVGAYFEFMGGPSITDPPSRLGASVCAYFEFMGGFSIADPPSRLALDRAYFEFMNGSWIADLSSRLVVLRMFVL